MRESEKSFIVLVIVGLLMWASPSVVLVLVFLFNIFAYYRDLWWEHKWRRDTPTKRLPDR